MNIFLNSMWCNNWASYFLPIWPEFVFGISLFCKTVFPKYFPFTHICIHMLCWFSDTGIMTSQSVDLDVTQKTMYIFLAMTNSQSFDSEFSSSNPASYGIKMKSIDIILGFKHTVTLHYETRGPFYKHGSTFIPAWISNYTYYNVWDEITYPFLNFNSATVEVYEWIKSHPTLYCACDYLSMLGLKLNHVSKRGHCSVNAWGTDLSK